MFTLPILTRPSYSAASSSSTGPIILHGPHHSAQKSTSTGVEAFSTSAAKFSFVKVTILRAAIIEWESHETQIGDTAKSASAPLGLLNSDLPRPRPKGSARTAKHRLCFQPPPAQRRRRRSRG